MTSSKITLKIAKILKQLSDGAAIPASSAKSSIIERMIEENIILSTGRHRRTLHVINKEQLLTYIDNQFQIKNLNEYIRILESEKINRAAATQTSTDSKLKSTRTFKGFLINCFSPIIAELNHRKITISPQPGSFIFISDYETFRLPSKITIVGIENAENFSNIRKQEYLFESITPLFISRYPQNQNKDVIKWLRSISSPYLHFGDFDIAGIGIYLSEYKKHLGNRASFFVPENIEETIVKYGNRNRFDSQKINFSKAQLNEPALSDLFETIQQTRKGLDQEFFIK